MFFFRQCSNESDWVTAPNLAARYEPSRWNNGVSENNRSALDARALHNYGVFANDAVVINYTAVDAAPCFDSYILTNVDRRSDTTWERVGSVDRCSVTNRGELSDSDGVVLSSDSNVVPNSCPFADEDISDESCVGSYPGFSGLRNCFVEGHDLAVS